MGQLNRGVIHEPIRPDTGFFGGVAGQLETKVADGNWEPYLPKFESQSRPFENMSCVSYSLLNTFETQANFHGIKINKSDRYLSWSSGTTPNGNSFSNVYDAALKGVCEEPLWPFGGSNIGEYQTAVPNDAAKSDAATMPTKWNLGMRVWVPNTIAAMKEAIKATPLWFCNSVHAMMIYRIDDKLRIFDSEANNTDGKGEFPLSYVSEIWTCYNVPFSPKHLAPTPVTNFPPNSLICVVDGKGQRYMNVDNTKLYFDDYGKIMLELTARNAKNGITQPFPVVHCKTSDISGLLIVNLKGEHVT